MQFADITPFLWVSDMDTALEFYCGAMGMELANEFRNETTDAIEWVYLESGQLSIMLSVYAGRILEPESDEHHEHLGPGRPEEAKHQRFVDAGGHTHLDPVHWIYVTDVDAAYQQLVEAGVQPEGQPEDQMYGLRDFLCLDPDGNALVFASV